MGDTGEGEKTVNGGVGQSASHESAEKHVTGEAVFVDDMFEHANQLHAALGISSRARARISSCDLTKVRACEGVVDVITAADIPGKNEIGPVFAGDPMLADGDVEFHGQPIFAVAATSYDLARRAVALAEIEYHDEATPVLEADDAAEAESYVLPPHTIGRGDTEAAIQGAPHVIEGIARVGGQEHMYIEGQVAQVIPTEDGGVHVYSSTQYPTQVSKTIAGVLGIAQHDVLVDVRRMGGAFGGKEIQATQWAAIAAVLARKTGQPVKLRLPRATDMVVTGKRHPFSSHYRAGFTDGGLLTGVDVQMNVDAGFSPDCTGAVVDRAMLDVDNAYYFDAAKITGVRGKTNKVSNTAFRGFGGPQAVAATEHMLDAIARARGLDPLDVRKRNLYGQGERNLTPYGQVVEHHRLPQIIDQLETESDYRARRAEIAAFNKANTVLKRGLALTPVKFGISFSLKRMNQAGALVNVYTDGSVNVNHGATEMGQGVYTRVAQVVANEFQVDLGNVRVTATRTDKVPNTSPTAGSTGTDMNGKAAQAAARIIKQRMIEFAAGHFGITAEEICFAGNRVTAGAQAFSFAEFVSLAFDNRVSLSATGFYKTPGVHFDRTAGQGSPYYYFSCGAAVSEVLIDTLTGENKTLRADVLFDAGAPINPALDIGQLEGGFVQGAGWVTMEELVWDAAGRLLSNNPATYKIPAIADAPDVFNVRLLEGVENHADTVHRSKGLSEPPVVLGLSVLGAIRDAVSSLSDYREMPALDAPATPEAILWAVEEMKARA